MAYRISITDRAESHMDQQINYILFGFNNKTAAKHLLDGIEQLYGRLEDNPYQFPICRDSLLENKGYREAVVMDMDYIVIFRIDEDVVYILGFFHQLENYKDKL